MHFRINIRFLCLCAQTLLLSLLLLLNVADRIMGLFFLMVRTVYTDPSLLCMSSFIVKLLYSALPLLYLRICRITPLILIFFKYLFM